MPKKYSSLTMILFNDKPFWGDKFGEGSIYKGQLPSGDLVAVKTLG